MYFMTLEEILSLFQFLWAVCLWVTFSNVVKNGFCSSFFLWQAVCDRVLSNEPFYSDKKTRPIQIVSNSHKNNDRNAIKILFLLYVHIIVWRSNWFLSIILFNIRQFSQDENSFSHFYIHTQAHWRKMEGKNQAVKICLCLISLLLFLTHSFYFFLSFKGEGRNLKLKIWIFVDFWPPCGFLLIVQSHDNNEDFLLFFYIKLFLLNR